MRKATITLFLLALALLLASVPVEGKTVFKNNWKKEIRDDGSFLAEWNPPLVNGADGLQDAQFIQSGGYWWLTTQEYIAKFSQSQMLMGMEIQDNLYSLSVDGVVQDLNETPIIIDPNPPLVDANTLTYEGPLYGNDTVSYIAHGGAVQEQITLYGPPTEIPTAIRYTLTLETPLALHADGQDVEDICPDQPGQRVRCLVRTRDIDLYSGGLLVSEFKAPLISVSELQGGLALPMEYVVRLTEETGVHHVFLEFPDDVLHSPSLYPLTIDPVISVRETGTTNRLRDLVHGPLSALSVAVGDEVSVFYDALSDHIEVVQLPNAVLTDALVYRDVSDELHVLGVGYSLPDLYPRLYRFRAIRDYGTLVPTATHITQDWLGSGISVMTSVLTSITYDNAGGDAALARWYLLGRNCLYTENNNCDGSIVEQLFEVPQATFLGRQIYGGFLMSDTWLHAEYNNQNDKLFITARDENIWSYAEGDVKPSLYHSATSNFRYFGEPEDLDDDNTLAPTTGGNVMLFPGKANSMGSVLKLDVSGTSGTKLCLWQTDSTAKIHSKEALFRPDGSFLAVMWTATDTEGYLAEVDSACSTVGTAEMLPDRPEAIDAISQETGIISTTHGKLILHGLDTPPAVVVTQPDMTDQVNYTGNGGWNKTLNYTVQFIIYSNEVQGADWTVWLNESINGTGDVRTGRVTEYSSAAGDYVFKALVSLGYNLSQGIYHIDVGVRDEGGHLAHDAQDITFIISEKASAEILSPANGTTVDEGTPLLFQGRIWNALEEWDALRGLNDNTYEWYADGAYLGGGAEFTHTFTEPGTYNVSFFGHDGQEYSKVDKATVIVKDVAGPPPDDGGDDGQDQGGDDADQDDKPPLEVADEWVGRTVTYGAFIMLLVGVVLYILNRRVRKDIKKMRGGKRK